jgi:WD40 repeat protein
MVVVCAILDEVSAVAVTPDGRYALSASGHADQPCEVRVWDLTTLRQVAFDGHARRVTSLAVSADGKSVVSGSYDETARLWNLATATGMTALLGLWASDRRDITKGRRVRIAVIGQDSYLDPSSNRF